MLEMVCFSPCVFRRGYILEYDASHIKRVAYTLAQEISETVYHTVVLCYISLAMGGVGGDLPALQYSCNPAAVAIVWQIVRVLAGARGRTDSVTCDLVETHTSETHDLPM